MIMPWCLRPCEGLHPEPVLGHPGIGGSVEPGLGFLHAHDARRPSLALDLMEEFGPLVVDKVIVVATPHRLTFGGRVPKGCTAMSGSRLTRRCHPRVHLDVPKGCTAMSG